MNECYELRHWFRFAAVMLDWSL